MKILVVGGMHGNERLGIDLVKLLRKKAIDGVDTYIANPRASRNNVRYIESDLNRSFGLQTKVTYETKRAKLMCKKVRDYDLVLDFHNTMTPQNNCSFVGVGCNKLLYRTSLALGLSNCVEATYDCINKYCPNTISIEISVGDSADNPNYWYDRMASISQANTGTVTVYRFFGRVTWDQKRATNTDDWRPFKQLNTSQSREFAAGLPVYPIFIGSRLTEYYATLLTKEKEFKIQ
jgi:hypothetical protein